MTYKTNGQFRESNGVLGGDGGELVLFNGSKKKEEKMHRVRVMCIGRRERSGARRGECTWQIASKQCRKLIAFNGLRRRKRRRKGRERQEMMMMGRADCCPAQMLPLIGANRQNGSDSAFDYGTLTAHCCQCGGAAASNWLSLHYQLKRPRTRTAPEGQSYWKGGRWVRRMILLLLLARLFDGCLKQLLTTRVKVDWKRGENALSVGISLTAERSQRKPSVR